LEGQVQEDEQHANGIAGLIGRASILRNHGAHDGSGDDDTNEASNVHLAA
jgi:hypothetical protein